jgi:hypothetical protein
MGVEKKVNFTRIRGEKESYQVCSQFFSADDKLIKLKLLIIDGQSKSAFKVRISSENFDKKEEIVKEAFKLSDSHDLEFRFDRENATTMLLYRQDVVFRNVPFSSKTSSTRVGRCLSSPSSTPTQKWKNLTT